MAALRVAPPLIRQDKYLVPSGILSFIEWLDTLHELIVPADLSLHPVKARSNIQMLVEFEELHVVYVNQSNFLAHHMNLRVEYARRFHSRRCS